MTSREPGAAPARQNVIFSWSERAAGGEGEGSRPELAVACSHKALSTAVGNATQVYRDFQWIRIAVLSNTEGLLASPLNGYG